MTLTLSFQAYVQRQLARVLTQMDRDPDSPTFGCFDRNYWHYKIRDYPSSILQQGVFTLEAIAKGHVCGISPPKNIDQWRVGAINALARQIDSQGRVSEYYPYEASYPAAAFGLYGAGRVLWNWQTEAPHLLDQIDQSSLQRLAYHLSGRLETEASNQHAAGLAGLAFATELNLLTRPKISLEQQAEQLFKNQHPEGWFYEYGGPDFGYLAVTIDTLVDYYEITQDERALTAIDRAVEFLACLVGADGQLPSTLNSRNTDYVVPYGLVRTAQRNPLATWLVETLFSKVDHPSHFCWATDDRYHCHYIFASIVRSLPYLEKMQPSQAPEGKSCWLPGCGYKIFWSSDRQWNAYVAAHKGGLVRIHRQHHSPVVEYGWRVEQQKTIWTNNWWSQNWKIAEKDHEISITGVCQKTQFHVPSPPKHIILRGLSFVLRENVIPLLKRVMIFRPGNSDGPEFERIVTLSPNGVIIEDRLSAFAQGTVTPSPRQNLRHVASADSFNLEEWLPSLLGTVDYSLTTPITHKSQWNPDTE